MKKVASTVLSGLAFYVGMAACTAMEQAYEKGSTEEDVATEAPKKEAPVGNVITDPVPVASAETSPSTPTSQGLSYKLQVNDVVCNKQYNGNWYAEQAYPGVPKEELAFVGFILIDQQQAVFPPGYVGSSIGTWIKDGAALVSCNQNQKIRFVRRVFE